MDLREFEAFRTILRRSGVSVSEIEYTQGNYDHDGSPIPYKVPSITTDLCNDIGLLRGGTVYFVVIIESQTFKPDFFERIKDMSGLNIYGLENFMDNLYPKKNFDKKEFFNKVLEDKYLQIQFDHEDADASGLAEKYFSIWDIMKESGAVIVNQLETDLAEKK